MQQMIVLVLSVVASGCIITHEPLEPYYEAGTPEATISPAPKIKVVYSYERRKGNDPQRSSGYSERHFYQAYERAAAESPFMQAATASQEEDVHYILFLDAISSEHGGTWALIDGLLFLMLLPAQVTTDYSVNATLYEAATGEEVGIYEASTMKRSTLWLPILLFTPIALALAPGDEDLYDPTFQEVFVQASYDLRDRPLPEAVPPQRLDIREAPAHKRRSIRLR